MAIKERKAGIYVRLSNEDSRAGESVSIENQKLMLTKHVKEMGWELVEVYADDGFSGTNQNRPSLQRMLLDIKQKRINTVLIKDAYVKQKLNFSTFINKIFFTNAQKHNAFFGAVLFNEFYKLHHYDLLVKLNCRFAYNGNLVGEIFACQFQYNAKYRNNKRPRLICRAEVGFFII